jgi:hypothetical protein
MKRYTLIGLTLLITSLGAYAQEDLLSILDQDSLMNEEEQSEFVSASFKTNRVINLQSLENTAPGVLDIKISHRFGPLDRGVYDLFGLDDATIRIGADLGLTDRLMIGGGRSSFEKTYDGFLKYRLLRQSNGDRKMPFSVSAFASTAIRTIRFANEQEDLLSSRMYYTYQLIIGRKFSDNFSLQVSPTMVHRNLVETIEEKNDVFAVAVAARQKLTKRISLNLEYAYVLPDQILDTEEFAYENMFSVGFDIETGGHVFQLHFTNAISMIEKGFITETNGDWFDGDIRFGFNISRVFTVWGREE